MQIAVIQIQQTVASTAAGEQSTTSDHKRETKSQRILQFQTYLAKFEQWHTVNPAHVKGKPGDPGLLSE